MDDTEPLNLAAVANRIHALLPGPREGMLSQLRPGLSGPGREHLEQLLNFNDYLERPLVLVRNLVPPGRRLGSEGQVIGKYRLRELLARGGFSEVWQAEHLHLVPSDESGADDAAVVPTCLKLLDPGLSGLPDVLAEARAMASIRHNNVVAVKDHGAADAGGQPLHYIEMELVGEFDPDNHFVPARSLAVEGVRDGAPRFDPRTAARIAAQICRGVQAAHLRDKVHRDLKPANVLLEPFSLTPKVIDFGLAASLVAGEGREGGAGTPSKSHRLAGTPGYMAPEQTRGEVTRLSDVYGLGAVLYFLLSGRAPYAPNDPAGPSGRTVGVLEQLREGRRPAPLPRKGLPRTLRHICEKAMAWEPAERYESAAAMGRDLEAFLDYWPTLADHPTPLGRLWLLCRRQTFAAVAATVLLVGALALSVLWIRSEVRSAVAVRQQQESQVLEHQFRSLVLEQQQIRLTGHREGWSRKSWDLAHRAGQVRATADLRDQAAACLPGVDVTTSCAFAFTTSSLVFNRDGRSLLVGGGRGQAAKWLDLATARLDELPVRQEGVVAFGENGTRTTVVREGRYLLMWDLTSNRELARCDVGEGGEPARWAVTPDGTAVAALVKWRDGVRSLFIWDGGGQLRYRLNDVSGDVIALSPDGTLAACGDEEGRVSICSTSGGTVEHQRFSNTTIRSLAFGRNPRSLRGDASGANDWVLAVGMASGSVVIWDVGDRTVSAHCAGSNYDVYALAFSPDGSLLASAGRTPAKLWDAATGRCLLDFDAGDYTSALAFSPDARHLATSSSHPPDGKRSFVWNVEHGRGIRALRGLRSVVERVACSPDGRRFAALSHDWRVGVWDRASGTLECVLDAPKGLVADNASLAFSPDGTRLALSAGKRAELWDLDRQSRLGSWELPPGLGDTLAFHSGRLLLFRFETEDGEPPYSNVSHREHPRVCRIRELVPGEAKPRPLADIRSFNWSVLSNVTVADGSIFVTQGLHDGPDGQRRAVKIFKSLTGEELWSRDVVMRHNWGPLTVDPAGTRVVYAEAADRMVLLDRAKGTVSPLRGAVPTTFSPDGRHYFSKDSFEGGFRCVALHVFGRADPLVRFGLDKDATGVTIAVDASGRFAAWGNADGTVSLCDLQETRNQLRSINLDW
jgi:serine/threonine-protein kinase